MQVFLLENGDNYEGFFVVDVFTTEEAAIAAAEAEYPRIKFEWVRQDYASCDGRTYLEFAVDGKYDIYQITTYEVKS